MRRAHGWHALPAPSPADIAARHGFADDGDVPNFDYVIVSFGTYHAVRGDPAVRARVQQLREQRRFAELAALAREIAGAARARAGLEVHA